MGERVAAELAAMRGSPHRSCGFSRSESGVLPDTAFART